MIIPHRPPGGVVYTRGNGKLCEEELRKLGGKKEGKTTQLTSSFIPKAFTTSVTSISIAFCEAHMVEALL
jgi:hypothetical protein